MSLRHLLVALLVALSLVLSSLSASADPGKSKHRGTDNFTSESTSANITWE